MVPAASATGGTFSGEGVGGAAPVDQSSAIFWIPNKPAQPRHRRANAAKLHDHKLT